MPVVDPAAVTMSAEVSVRPGDRFILVRAIAENVPELERAEVYFWVLMPNEQGLARRLKAAIVAGAAGTVGIARNGKGRAIEFASRVRPGRAMNEDLRRLGF